MTLQPSGSASGTMTLTTSLFGSIVSGQLGVGEANNLFSTLPLRINVDALGNLKPFVDLDAEQFKQSIRDFETFIKTLGATNALDSKVHFTDQTFAQALQLDGLWNSAITQLLEPRKLNPFERFRTSSSKWSENCWWFVHGCEQAIANQV